jgi:thymidylate synthase
MVGVFEEGSRDKQDQSASEVEIIKTPSRNGPVLQIMEPVILTYTHPRERVLLNQERDANPFFHLYESLFMLSGRNEIAPLAYYAGNMSNYSDDGVTQNGAYGYRWRHAEGNDSHRMAGIEHDQLKVIIDHLKRKPDSRRAVLHMSNVEDDLLKMDTTKDQACNLCVMFLLRSVDMKSQEHKVLDMTVTNRSNDLIFGALGANQVHFGFLQEYMAAHIGVEVGVYNQITNNLHVYLENNSGFHPERWLKEYESPETSTTTWYTDDATNMIPLVKDPETFDEELPKFVKAFGGEGTEEETHTNWKEPFFQEVAAPMLWAFNCHKRRLYRSALLSLSDVRADDWREAGRNWLLKRQKNWEAKEQERNNAL